MEDRQVWEKSRQKSLIPSKNREKACIRLKQLDMFAELLNMSYEVVGKLIDDSDISSLGVYAYAIR